MSGTQIVTGCVLLLHPHGQKTRAASGVSHFDELEERATAQRLADIAEVGRVVAFLVGGASSGMTGDTISIDGGLRKMD
jgi:enoyl-[acyl-carrier protein] reductase I